MDTIKAKSILDIPNSRVGSYDFVAASGDRNEGQYFCNDFVGLPSIPIIGKYGKNGYETNEVALLTVHECFCDESSFRITSSATQEEINLPFKVKSVIFTIPEVIKHNKPITDDKDENDQKGKKINHGGDDDHDHESDKHNNKNKGKKKPNTIPEFHPFEFPPAFQINFLWNVSFQNKKIFTKAHPNFMNMVFHPYIYQTIIFETTKRMFTNIPVCLIQAGDDSCGVKYWEKDQRSISFDTLRSEYLSVHMKGPSLCFSPNNMKFEMNPDLDIVHFFTFVLTEDGFYHIIYNWNVNDVNLHAPLSKLFKSSSTTRQVIQNMGNIISPDHPALVYVKNIFSISKQENKNEEKQMKQTEYMPNSLFNQNDNTTIQSEEIKKQD